MNKFWKELLPWACLAVMLVVSYMDSHYWHSLWSYYFLGDWHKCKVVGFMADAGPDLDYEKFQCAEGEVTIHWKGSK